MAAWYSAKLVSRSRLERRGISEVAQRTKSTSLHTWSAPVCGVTTTRPRSRRSTRCARASARATAADADAAAAAAAAAASSAATPSATGRPPDGLFSRTSCCASRCAWTAISRISSAPTPVSASASSTASCAGCRRSSDPSKRHSAGPSAAAALCSGGVKKPSGSSARSGSGASAGTKRTPYSLRSAAAISQKPCLGFVLIEARNTSSSWTAVSHAGCGSSSPSAALSGCTVTLCTPRRSASRRRRLKGAISGSGLSATSSQPTQMCSPICGYRRVGRGGEKRQW